MPERPTKKLSFYKHVHTNILTENTDIIHDNNNRDITNKNNIDIMNHTVLSMSYSPFLFIPYKNSYLWSFMVIYQYINWAFLVPFYVGLFGMGLSGTAFLTLYHIDLPLVSLSTSLQKIGQSGFLCRPIMLHVQVCGAEYFYFSYATA